MKRTALSFALMATLLAYGCSKSEKIDGPIVPVEDTLVMQRGELLEKIDDKNILLQTEKGERVYKIPQKYEEDFKKIDVNELIEFNYKENKYGESMIQEYSTLGQSHSGKVAEETQKKKKKKNDNQKGEEILIVDGQKLSATLSESSLGFKIKTLNEYELEDTDEETVTLQKSGSFNSISIETLPNDSEIKRLRWDAASGLEGIGELKELHDNEINNDLYRNAEFIFQSTNDRVSKTYAIKNINGKLFRFIINLDIATLHEEERFLYAMADSIE